MGLFKPVRRGLRRLKNIGLRCYCPCCSAHLSRFHPWGFPVRPEAICPVCGSLERHRLIYLYFRARTNFFDGTPKKVLHVAPEEQIAYVLRRPAYIEYVSADLHNPKAMVRMDVTDIEYPDNSFDVIYCSHVLEHVTEDRKAMSEFHRVLKPNGWAILQVPVSTQPTIEDPTVTSPEERLRLFGQDDHVRLYGPDYADRLTEIGFDVRVDGFVREMDDFDIRRLGVKRTENVYFCGKRAA